MADFDIRKGDTVPFIESDLENGLGEPANLIGAEVRFVMTPIRGATSAKVNGAAGVVESPRVRYTWQSGDLDTPGGYYGYWFVTYQDGRQETFPNDHPLTIAIHEDLREGSPV